MEDISWDCNLDTFNEHCKSAMKCLLGMGDESAPLA